MYKLHRNLVQNQFSTNYHQRGISPEKHQKDEHIVCAKRLHFSLGLTLSLPLLTLSSVKYGREKYLTFSSTCEGLVVGEGFSNNTEILSQWQSRTLGDAPSPYILPHTSQTCSSSGFLTQFHKGQKKKGKQESRKECTRERKRKGQEECLRKQSPLQKAPESESMQNELRELGTSQLSRDGSLQIRLNPSSLWLDWCWKKTTLGRGWRVILQRFPASPTPHIKAIILEIL